MKHITPIINVEEHLACPCYGPADRPIAEVLEFTQGAIRENISMASNEMMFVLEGSTHVHLHSDGRSGRVERGEMLFLPAGEQISAHVPRTCRLLVLRTASHPKMCHQLEVAELYDEPFVEPETSLFLLRANEHLTAFARSLSRLISDGLLCRVFLENKISEALTLLRVYYSREQLRRFFRPILGADNKFAEVVRASWQRCGTIHRLSATLCMTPAQFTKRFKTVFGELPSQWMLREKANLIYQEVCHTDKPLKEIADDFGYSITENFIRFCKKSLGDSPGALRKRTRRLQ